MPATTDCSLSGKKIYVAGHKGMVGSAIVRRLEQEKNVTIVTADRARADLTRQADVEAFFKEEKPDLVFVAAAKVGGIHANNTLPADFLYDNLMIEANVIHAAYKQNVEKLLFLGSTCIYPREAQQPITEDALLTGPLEPTNEAYAVAKIAGIKLCQAYRAQHGCNFISAMPTNLYGPNDNYDLQNSHVLPALIRKAYDAKQTGADHLPVWGSGRPMREFLYVDDLADALVFLMQYYSDAPHLNVGTGTDVTIRELAEKVCQTVGFEGDLVFDPSKPDGMMRKVTDVSRLSSLGWKASTCLDEGLAKAYKWFLENQSSARL